MKKFDFLIHGTAFNKETNKQVINRRFHKLRYTAALRLGVVPQLKDDAILFQFEGEETNEIVAHRLNQALSGDLIIDGTRFEDIIAIINDSFPKRPRLITFWPISQDPDAKDSYTDPLVDTAMGGSPYDINRVATVMHEKFKMNAGVSPALLMKILYEAENQELKNLAENTARQLNDSQRQLGEALELNNELKVKEASANTRAMLEAERAESEKFEKERVIHDSLQKDEIIRNKDLLIQKLQKQSLMKPVRGETVTESNVAYIDKVVEGFKGKNNQRAIILMMSDGTERANNWDRDYEARLQLAQKLCSEKRLVRTDVWNLPGTNYRWQNWFKNIYIVD